MRCVLITPLGSLVEPEVNRNLAIVSGPTLACAASTAAPAGVASRSAKAVTARPSTRAVGSAPPSTSARDRGGDRLAVRRRRWRTPGPASACRGCGAACRSPATAANTPARSARTGTPAHIAPSASGRCSRSLSDRMATGRSADSPRSSSAWPMRCARSSICGVADALPVAAVARAWRRSVRSPARSAQCSRRSVRRSGYQRSGSRRLDQRCAVGAARRAWPRCSRRPRSGRMRGRWPALTTPSPPCRRALRGRRAAGLGPRACSRRWRPSATR